MKDVQLSEKRKFNFKRLIYSLGYFVIIAVVAFISSGGFSNNPDWGNVIRKIVTTWSMTATLMYLSYQDKYLSIIDDLKSSLMISSSIVEDKTNKLYRMGLNFAFSEYTHALYIKRRDRFLIGKLEKIGLTDGYILTLTFEQLKNLCTTPAIINGHAFDILTENQYAEIYKIKIGTYKYKEIPSDYFLTSSNGANIDQYTHYANIAEYRRNKKIKQILIKMAMIAVFAIAFALVAPPKEDQLLEMIMTMLSTTANGIGGIITGVLWARRDAKDNTDENYFKTKSIDEFFSDYNSGMFIPLDLTDVVKQKLKALAEAEQENEEDSDDEEDDD